MPNLDHFFKALSWTLIHSLWIGVMFSIVAGLLLLLTRKQSALVRYGSLISLFVFFVIAIVICFIAEWQTIEPLSSAFTNTIAADYESARVNILYSFYRSVQGFIVANSSWLVLTWGAILLYKAGRMVLDVLYVNRIRQVRVQQVTPQWQQTLTSLSASMNIKRTTSLVESALVSVPMVAGHFKPVILFPLGVLAQLPASQVEAILLHELAHIRRHDYLVNFFQRIVEGLFFFNPGLLWISKLIRIERENCCDDLALQQTDRTQLVFALVNFKEYSVKQSGYVLALFGNKGELIRRMTRLVYNKNRSLTSKEAGFLILNAIIFIMLLTGLSNINGTALSIPAMSWHEPATSTPLNGRSIVTETARELTYEASAQEVSVNNPGDQLKLTGKEIKQLPFKAAVKANHWASPVSSDKSRENEDRIEMENVSIYNADHAVGATGESRTDLEALHHKAADARARAQRDREVAEHHRAQSSLDRQQAERDRAAAELHRVEAEQYRLQAEKQREIAEHHRAEAMERRLLAERNAAVANRHKERLETEKPDTRTQL